MNSIQKTGNGVIRKFKRLISWFFMAVLGAGTGAIGAPSADGQIPGAKESFYLGGKLRGQHLRFAVNGASTPDESDRNTADAESLGIKRVFIYGITAEDEKFRPSNWAERLYYAGASYSSNHTAIFNPHVNMGVSPQGMKCVMVDTELQLENPMLFGFLIDFAKDNQLVMQDQDGNLLTVT
ncbi:DUF3579 domain-containing protein [Nitrosococcus watsonii]|uniref:Uncharacterized protein n=1 Tax=Nitrosococcus watsoni (strain C-113) TaxID=105559 RepID=D8K873_NITWC|nr:DUF3579 domain-containing protein [Nitrosococcus watsonii]ADJ27068.1 conserved hypothetical protein [Nitrosococcus watsonii C-113]